MIILAAALTLGINLEIDLGALISRHNRRAPVATCGIKTVGYRISGDPGREFRYAGENFTIPAEGYVEVISLPKLTTYTVEGKTLALEDGVSPLDAFSFRWITLPASASKGE